ncbi:prolipoprotein diacylglyceryl transferase [Candidatus Arthromitus sp. SFB-rat-Yit]|uniref:prolipoprotein diacylglyceryl transferase n=1 Tax=Candidatus Arthromitus sp. SFB-rat-Yit TaxID=1041504 RepID=UPI000227A1DB|nr:prolipoprotein diacylglyceryl transferase [Candidatus Arthromitus sp. SFB-rat-Yit]BAK80752.1 prolipoprotein diacylglyceryl transferase [Candidatus Arthromitus sp. SFB-rat-Yit]
MDKIAFPNLGLEFMVNKIAFSIFGVDIAWYAIIITIGIIVAMIISYRNAKSIGLDTERFMDMFFYMIVFGVIGARIYYVIFNFSLYKDNLLSVFNIREGGIAIYGAVLFGALTVFIYTKIKKQNFLDCTDCIVPGLAIAQGIGRWGNFINQEAYGYETNSLFGMSINEGNRIITVHPTFLYESVLNIFVFIVLIIFFNKYRKNSGEVTCIYGVLYGIGRFFIEGMRTDSLYLGAFRVSQIVSLVFVVIGIGLFMYLRSNNKIKE